MDLRVCDVCGVVDTAPRHVMWAPGAPMAKPAPEIVRSVAARTDLDPAVYDAALKELLDTDSVCRHMDCCASVGCPDHSCDSIVASSGGAKDDALRAYITGGN